LRQLPQVAEQAAAPELLAEEREAEGLQVEQLPVGARAGVVVLQEVRPAVLRLAVDVAAVVAEIRKAAPRSVVRVPILRSLPASPKST
jgi:hypothetical protein